MDKELLVNYLKDWERVLRLKLKADNEGKRKTYSLSTGYYKDAMKLLNSTNKKLIKIGRAHV